MNITKQHLDNAAEQQIISSEQAQALYLFLHSQQQDQPHFSMTHILYYLGGLVAIGAMTLFMNLGWEAFGGAGVFFITLLYAGVGLTLTQRFANQGLPIPAGICATFVVCLTPLAIYGLQQWIGWWPDDAAYRDYHRYIQWHWLYMELGTLVVGVSMAWRYKYPFLILPIAVTLWYMSMDLTAMLTAGDYNWELRQLVSLYVGLLIIGLAFWVDIRAQHSADYAFWLYIFGVIAFWGGLSLQDSGSELGKLLYCAINLVMIGVGVLLKRKVFVVFGALGCSGYLGHLAYDVFADSWLFPITLSLIGLGIIYLGVLWQKNEQAITERARAYLPSKIRFVLER